LLSLSLLPANRGLAQSGNAEYDDCMAKAQKLFRAGNDDEAIKEYRHAIKLSGEKNYEPYWGIAQAYLNAGATKNVMDSCEQVVKLAPDDKWKARAIDMKGLALFQDSGNDRRKLEKAEEQFRAAIQVNQYLAPAHYNLGLTLLKENRDDDGKVELNSYLSMSPNGPEADRAKEFIANTRRARENFAPDFSFTSSKGEYISLDDLRGKVILVEFWATWCGPCKEAFPELVSLYKRDAKEKFVFLSISVDSDKNAWDSFLVKSHPDWPQAIDTNGKLHKLFFPPGARSGIPNYFVIDGEGIIRQNLIGWGYGRAGELQDAIKKYLKNLPAAAPTGE
jgi:thiol-disulfide isomerase/thioredoxin